MDPNKVAEAMAFFLLVLWLGLALALVTVVIAGTFIMGWFFAKGIFGV